MFKRRRFVDLPAIDAADPKTLVIARGARVEGRLAAPADAIVAGLVVGDIEVGGRLVVLAEASVQGSVRADQARVDGTIHGPICVGDRLEVGASARLEGDVSAGTASVAEGAVLLGALRIVGESRTFVERRRGRSGPTPARSAAPSSTVDADVPAQDAPAYARDPVGVGVGSGEADTER